MALGTGTHWQGPLLGAVGAYEELPAAIQSQRDAWYVFFDFNEGAQVAVGAGTSWATGTQIGATGTVAAVNNQPGGIMRVTSGAVDNAGIGSWQFLPNSGCIPTTANSLSGLDNRKIAFGARIAISDFSVSDWFFGLATVDTTLMLATGLLAATGGDNCVGFQHAGEAVNQGGISSAAGGDGNDVRLVSAGTAVANMQGTLLSAAQVPRVALANADIDGVFFDYAVQIIGLQTVEFYINGTLRHRRLMGTAFAAAQNLLPSFTNVCAGGADCNMDIDYVWFGATR